METLTISKVSIVYLFFHYIQEDIKAANLKNSSIFNNFIQNIDEVYTFVLSDNYDILESNKGYTGDFSKLISKEDTIRFDKHISKKLACNLYIFVTPLNSNIQVSLRCNTWIENDIIYIIGKECSPEAYYEDINQKMSKYIQTATLNTEGKVIQSDSENFILNTYYPDNCQEDVKEKLIPAFKYSVKHKLISGIEHSKDDNLTGSTLYRFIPKIEDDKLLITLIKQELDFSNYGNYSENYFQDMIDNSADFIYKNDPQGYFIYVNDIGKKKYNFAPSAEGKMHYTDWIRPDYKVLVNKFYSNQIEQRIETTYLEFPTIADNNEEVWVGQNVRIVFSGDWVLGVQTTARDITENKIIENELMEIQSKNQAILDTIPDSMFLISNKYELLDKKVENCSYLLDVDVNDFIYNSDLKKEVVKEISNGITKSLTDQKIIKLELTNDSSEKEEIHDIRIAPVDDSQVLLLVRNITTQIKQQRTLQNSQLKEREALDAKQRYLSFMTHEIRTPLNAIIGLNDLIFDTNPTPKQMEYLKSIRSSSSILSKIINDVLDFNKLENNKIRLDSTNFSLSRIFKDVIRTCNVYSVQKPVDLNYKIDDHIPTILKGDGAKLTQVLTNLISNALKFTQRGHVTANATLLEINDLHSKIAFSVSDTGIGIPKDKIEEVFNSYEQINNSISRKYGGTGLGLTISQKFIELMGGKIEIMSEVDEGSVFSFTLNFEISTDTPKIEKTPTHVDLSSFHILLVEDNEMNQLVMGKYFKKWGLSYDIAENGLEALEKIEEKEYHLVFLDLEMPVMDGFETAKLIRTHKNSDINQMRIIALSASVFSEVEDRTKKIGFNDFIGKPINSNYVYLKLTEYLLGNETKFLAGNVTNFNIENGMSFDLSYLLESSLNDSTYVKKMVELFLSKTPNYIEELFELLEEKKYTELKKLAHKYKASVAIMGVREAETAIHQLENNISKNINLDDSYDLLKKVKIASLTACNEISSRIKTNTLF